MPKYQKQNINADNDAAAAPMIFAAKIVSYAGSDKTHDKSDENQPEHIPKKIEQRHKSRPNEINPVYPDKR